MLSSFSPSVGHCAHLYLVHFGHCRTITVGRLAALLRIPLTLPCLRAIRHLWKHRTAPYRGRIIPWPQPSGYKPGTICLWTLTHGPCTTAVGTTKHHAAAIPLHHPARIISCSATSPLRPTRSLVCSHRMTAIKQRHIEIIIMLCTASATTRIFHEIPEGMARYQRSHVRYGPVLVNYDRREMSTIPLKE